MNISLIHCWKVRDYEDVSYFIQQGFLMFSEKCNCSKLPGFQKFSFEMINQQSFFTPINIEMQIKMKML